MERNPIHKGVFFSQANNDIIPSRFFFNHSVINGLDYGQPGGGGQFQASYWDSSAPDEFLSNDATLLYVVLKTICLEAQKSWV